MGLWGYLRGLRDEYHEARDKQARVMKARARLAERRAEREAKATSFGTSDAGYFILQISGTPQAEEVGFMTGGWVPAIGQVPYMGGEALYVFSSRGRADTFSGMYIETLRRQGLWPSIEIGEFGAGDIRKLGHSFRCETIVLDVDIQAGSFPLHATETFGEDASGG